MTYGYPSQMIGDVFLLNGTVKRSKLNRQLQTVWTARKAQYSHVAFSLGCGEFIHSDSETGVDFIFIDDLLSRYDGKWAAIRNDHLFEKACHDYLSVRNAAMYFLSQSYSIKGYFKKVPPGDSSFCSQLVASIFERLDIKLPGLPNKTLPVNFQELVTHPTWKDVTEEHKMAIAVTLQIPEIKEDFKQYSVLPRNSQIEIKRCVADYNAVNKCLKAGHDLDVRLGLKKGPFQKLPFKRFLEDFWDSNQPKSDDGLNKGE